MEFTARSRIPHSDSDTHSDTNTHSDANPNSYAHTDTNSYAYSHTDSDAHSNSDTDPGSELFVSDQSIICHRPARRWNSHLYHHDHTDRRLQLAC